MEVQSQLIEVQDNSIEYVLCFYSIKDDSGQPISQHVGTFVWNQTDPVYLIPVTNLPGFIKQTMTQGVVLPNQTRSPNGPKIISPTNGLEFLNAIKTRYGYGIKLYTSEITQRPKTDIPVEAIR